VREEEICSRWYAEPVEELRVRSDYGTLVPFCGTQSKYGLMTQEGKVVVDPVYSSVDSISYYDWGAGANHAFPAYVLGRLTGGVDEDGMAEEAYTYVGIDGSWSSGPWPSHAASASEGRLLLQAGDRWELRDETGALLRSYTGEELGLDDTVVWAWPEWCGGKVYLWHDETDASDLYVIDGETGEVELWTAAAWQSWTAQENQWLDWEVQSEDGQTVLTRGEERYVLPYDCDNSYSFEVVDDLIHFWEGGEGSGPVYRLDGTEIVPAGKYAWVYFWGDNDGEEYPLRAADDAGNTSILNRNGQEVFTVAWFDTILGQWDGIIGVQKETCVAYYDLSTGNCVLRLSRYGDGE
jgi:hypothetical protein